MSVFKKGDEVYDVVRECVWEVVEEEVERQYKNGRRYIWVKGLPTTVSAQHGELLALQKDILKPYRSRLLMSILLSGDG